MGWLGGRGGRKSDGARSGERAVASGSGPGAGCSPPSPGSIQPGGRIGKYELIAKIGGGGFGTVYEGFDPLIQRKVAIKTCEVGAPEMRARTFQEAKLAGRLQHPN